MLIPIVPNGESNIVYKSCYRRDRNEDCLSMDSNVPYIILGVHSTQAVEDCLNNGASAVVVDGNFLNKDDLKRFGTDRVYLKIKADNIENDPAYTKVVYEIDDASDAVDTVLALKKVNKQVEYIVLCTICSYDTLTKLHRHHIDVMVGAYF